MMYIVAAVDVDVREAKRAAKANAAATAPQGTGSDAAAQRGAEGLGSRWGRGDEGRIHVHEQVVCSIKAHQNGTLEIAPGVCVCVCARASHFTARYIVATNRFTDFFFSRARFAQNNERALLRRTIGNRTNYC